MPNSPLSSGDIRKAFLSPIAPVPVTFGYRIRLLGVLLGLVVLQVSYLLLIALVAVLTWLYLFAILNSNLPFSALTLIFIVGPPFAGIVGVIFLVKPLLIRPPRPPEPLRLLPENEPVLFEFVETLCREIGSPLPARISVDLQVNASASVRGWRGLFLGNPDLTIGLPLAAGMSLPEFTAVLSHEFGHFAQRAGLRLHTLIRNIQAWFARVVGERDGLDQWLEQMRRKRDWRLKGIGHLAHFVVEGSRRYLALLMRAGNWISCSFSRQMEFDADRCSAAIVGPAAFESTQLRVPILAVGAQLAWQEANREWSMRRLPDNVASLVAERTTWLPGEAVGQIQSQTLGGKTGSHDTHPCTADRIASVKRSGLTGVLVLDGSADRLFRDLPALCREATRHHYDKVLKLPLDSARLVPIEETIAAVKAAQEWDRATRELFHAAPDFCARWFRLPESGIAPSPAQQTDAPLDAATFDKAVLTSFNHFAAFEIRRTGVAIKPATFELETTDLAEIQACRVASEQRFRGLMASCRNASVGASARIAAIPQLESVGKCYRTMSGFQDDLIEIRRRIFTAQIVRNNSRLFRAAACANLLEELESTAVSKIEAIVAATTDVATPLVLDIRAAPTVGAQLRMNDLPRTERIASFVSRFDAIAARALGELCRVAVSQNFSSESASC